MSEEVHLHLEQLMEASQYGTAEIVEELARMETVSRKVQLALLQTHSRELKEWQTAMGRVRVAVEKWHP